MNRIAPTADLEIALDDGLTLRSAHNTGDIARIATLANTVFGPEVGLLQEHLAARLPGLEPADHFFVETADGAVVSILCLIPWTWRYGCVSLPVGEMGIVATDAAYRRRGLVRAQVGPFKQRLTQRGYLLSCIQGIPNYYRQFGYEYSLPLEGGVRLELRHASTDVDTGHTLRLATAEDIPALAELYNAAVADLDLYAERDLTRWQFLLGPEPAGHATIHQTWLIVSPEGGIAGYARLPHFHFGDELVVDEASRMTLEAAQALLAHLRRSAERDGQPALRFSLPAHHDLMRIVTALGGQDLGTYAWQIYVPDLVALLSTLIPELNRRLAGSVFRAYTHRLRLGTYREVIEIDIQSGRIMEVKRGARDAHTDCAVPMQALIPLILGHKDFATLRAIYPDIDAPGLWRLLLETLFPPMRAFIYPGY